MNNWAWDYEESGERHEWYYHIYSDDPAFSICITAIESLENDAAVDDLVNVLNMQYRRLKELQNHLALSIEMRERG